VPDSVDNQYLSNLKRFCQQLSGFSRERGNLIPLLQLAQHCVGFLPPKAIDLVAGHLGLSPSEVFGVATFYNQFRFTPPGRHPIKVCLGTACHIKGGEIILENFERKLQIQAGQTTLDQCFSLERVACVGCCALAPVALMGEAIHGHMAPSKVEGLVLQVEIEEEKHRNRKQHHATE
jgi:NADH-quinone oxidoreductase subunit E